MSSNGAAERENGTAPAFHSSEAALLYKAHIWESLPPHHPKEKPVLHLFMLCIKIFSRLYKLCYIKAWASPGEISKTPRRFHRLYNKTHVKEIKPPGLAELLCYSISTDCPLQIKLWGKLKETKWALRWHQNDTAWFPGKAGCQVDGAEGRWGLHLLWFHFTNEKWTKCASYCYLYPNQRQGNFIKF